MVHVVIMKKKNLKFSKRQSLSIHVSHDSDSDVSTDMTKMLVDNGWMICNK